MLYKLSISNIKKSFKDYAIYFVTLILGVCIFYIFNSMGSQTAMLEVSNRQGEMIDLLTRLLSYVSVFVSFILGFLIIYASRFLIKKRNKEFGIYMTLGMSKRKISFLLYTGHGGEQYCLYPGQNAPAAGGDTALPYSDRLL